MHFVMVIMNMLHHEFWKYHQSTSQKRAKVIQNLIVCCGLQDSFLHICRQLAYALHEKMEDMLGAEYHKLAEQKLVHMTTTGSEADDPEAHQLSVCLLL